MFNKITAGYVVQTFDDSGKCIHQEFIAEEVVFDSNPVQYQYQSYDMVQPTNCRTSNVYALGNGSG